MPLHRGQLKYLDAVKSGKYRKFILVPANRYGKSTLISCLQIWYLFYKFGIPPGNRETWFKAEYRTANIAPHSALTEPVFKTIANILQSKFPINTQDGRIVTNKCHIEWFYIPERTLNTPPYKQFFSNNSYIEHRSLGGDGGDSLQGKPYGIITYDEGGRSLHLEEELSGNILPRLFDWSAPFHLLSTPDQNSPSILYHYQLFQEGQMGMNQTYSQEGSLKDNGFFTPDHIQEQYDMFADDPLKDQILEGKFIFGGDSIFNYQDILEAEDKELNDGIRRIDGHNYVIGIDTAIGSDEMVYTVLDCTVRPFKLVKMIACKGNSKSPQLHLNDFLDLFDAYRGDNNRITVMLETWNGESVRFYHDLPPHVQSVTRCYGSWQPERRVSDNKNLPRPKNQAVKKADLLLSLKKLLAAKELKLPANNAPLTQQLSIYKEKDDNIPTDRVMSLALAAWLASETSFNQEIKWMKWK
jgi:hypothetical protein